MGEIAAPRAVPAVAPAPKPPRAGAGSSRKPSGPSGPPWAPAPEPERLFGPLPVAASSAMLPDPGPGIRVPGDMNSLAGSSPDAPAAGGISRRGPAPRIRTSRRGLSPTASAPARTGTPRCQPGRGWALPRRRSRPIMCRRRPPTWARRRHRISPCRPGPRVSCSVAPPDPVPPDPVPPGMTAPGMTAPGMTAPGMTAPDDPAVRPVAEADIAPRPRLTPATSGTWPGTTCSLPPISLPPIPLGRPHPPATRTGQGQDPD